MTHGGDDVVALEASLRRRFRVVETTVRVGAREIAILHPASAEDLIDERDFERDERLPYWAELWPSSRVLAEVVTALDGAGRTALELGCGAGLVSTCAALAGFDVAASDYYEDALRFARVNAAHNSTSIRAGHLLDWRHLPARMTRVDLVLASDVLYERPYGALVARVIARSLRPDGRALVADPGRVGREAFVASLAGLGLMLHAQTDHPFTDGEVRQTISVLEITWVPDM